MNIIKENGVLILDFGSQYTQLIARRIREENVFSEVVSCEIPLLDIIEKRPGAIILSGGPSSIYDGDRPNFDLDILNSKIPILGICYGLHLLVQHNGGEVEKSNYGEYGLANINIQKKSILLNNIPSNTKVWMSHGDKVTKLPSGWITLALSSNNIMAAISNEDQTIFATQFHPEVMHTEEGAKIIRNFIFDIGKCEKKWTAGNFIDFQVDKIRKKVPKGKVLLGVSGGVDSSVVAAILTKAIGNRAIAVLIDHGLLRKDEATECISALKDGLKVNIESYDESKVFLSKLNQIIDPEQKRKIIGNQFIYSFEKIAKKFGNIKYLAQGTLYPDVIESGISLGNTSKLIKSHHNVGGLPKNMKFKLIEPIRELFKDEVRKVGIQLGIPSSLIQRHPFPGPGLAVRIVGEITKERVKILQEADKVYIDILQKDNLYDQIWQAFAILIPIKTVGVMGDKRTYENLIGLRAVTSVDGMTADWFDMPHNTLNKISNQIINSVSGVNRVVYDVTSKPPGTIEWE
jgi:GMP synthase (glutamine-hydrolysing)